MHDYSPSDVGALFKVSLMLELLGFPRLLLAGAPEDYKWTIAITGILWFVGMTIAYVCQKGEAAEIDNTMIGNKELL